MAADLFATLRSLLVPYATHFEVTSDTADSYELWEDMPTARTLFASVQRGKKGVDLTPWALKYFKDITLPTSLVAKKMTSYPNTLRFESITAPQKAALAKALAAAWKQIAARRKLAPTSAYYRTPGA